MVPIFDCFDRPFRWHSEGAWMARIEAFMTNRFLSPPKITESEEINRKNVQEKINNEQITAR